MNAQKIKLLAFFGLVVAPVVLILLIMPIARNRAETRQCSDRLATLVAAARSYASAHSGRLPPDFVSIADTLGSPAVLICPADRKRAAALSWALFTPAHSSYEIVSEATTLQPGAAFVRCKVHGLRGYTKNFDRRSTSLAGHPARSARGAKQS